MLGHPLHAMLAMHLWLHLSLRPPQDNTHAPAGHYCRLTEQRPIASKSWATSPINPKLNVFPRICCRHQLPLAVCSAGATRQALLKTTCNSTHKLATKVRQLYVQEQNFPKLERQQTTDVQIWQTITSQ